MDEEKRIEGGEAASAVETAENVVPESTIGVIAEEAPKKANKGLIAIIAAVVAVIVIGAAVVVSFGSSQKQVLSAVNKTFDMENSVVGLWENASIMDAKSASATMDMEIGGAQGVTVHMQADSDIDLKQSEITLDLGYMGIKANADMYIDESTAQISIPLLHNSVFTYDYTAEKTGYLEQMLASADMTFEDIDNMLKATYQSTEADKELENKLVDITKSRFAGLDYEKVDARDFEVNGATVSCKGHKATITSEYLKDWVTEYKDAVMNFYEEMGMTGGVYKTQMEQYEEMFDQIIESLDQSEGDEPTNLDITFYVDGGLFSANQLAAIVLSDDEEGGFEVDFKGGDFPLQNGAILVKEGDEVTGEIAWEGTIDGDTHTLAVKSEGEELCKMTYSAESGAYSIDIMGEMTFKGTFVVNDEIFKLTVDEVEGFDQLGGFKFGMEMTEGAKEMKAPTGEGTFDLGNATEEEWSNLTNEVFGNLLSNPDTTALLMGL